MKERLPMTTPAYQEFYNRKIELLKQCLQLSEELLSNIAQWEMLGEILGKRQMILDEIKKNEDFYGNEVADSCTRDQKQEINRLIKLITDLDKNASDKIRAEQENSLNSIKTNVQEQKLLNYGTFYSSSSGKLLDKKK